MRKRYKLKKWYPSLPKNWETDMLVGIGDNNWGYSPVSSKYEYNATLPKSEVQNNPEFWEEIKEKEPLFVTEDGVEIFEGDRYYHVSHLYTGWSDPLSPKGLINMKIDTYIAAKNGISYIAPSFSTKEAAEKWIDNNKPIYSKGDISYALDKCTTLRAMSRNEFEHILGI